MALLPLFWLGVRRERRVEWWWLAVAFAVSWLADLAAHYTNPWLPAAVYPMSQAAMVGALFVRRDNILPLVIVLACVGMGAVWWEGTDGPSMVLQVIASGTVVAIVWPLATSRLRTTLLVAFGGGAVTWVAFVLAPGWETWGAYQAVRAASLGLFCWANVGPHPSMRLV